MRRRLLVALLALCPAALAYETDQYSQRLHPVADTLPLLDALVNRALQDIAREWSGPRSDMRLARAVYRKLGGHYWVDQFERTVLDSPQVQRLPVADSGTVYNNASLLAGRITVIAGLGPTLQLNNALVGSDKFGHFFSQGFKYYRLYMQAGRRESTRLLEYGARVERRFFGAVTTGIYSNADLVANYEGYRFYRSLTQATDRPALFVWRGNRPVLQRAFSWQHFVNEYWDEGINASQFGSGLAEYLDSRLQDFCADYRKWPARYRAQRDAELRGRYARIGIVGNSAYRVDTHCHSRSIAAP